MKHLMVFEDFNNRHMEFLASNSSAGTQGKEATPPGSTPSYTSHSDYVRNLQNAFDDFNIAFRKKREKKKRKKKNNFFKGHKRK